MLGVSLIIIAAAIVYMVETYISTYYTIEYMHGTSLFLILLAKYGTPVLFLLLCAYIAYRNFLKKQKAAASATSEWPTSKEELYTNKIQNWNPQNVSSMTDWMTRFARLQCLMKRNTRLSVWSETARSSATSATRWMRRSIWSPPCTMAEK